MPYSLPPSAQTIQSGRKARWTALEPNPGKAQRFVADDYEARNRLRPRERRAKDPIRWVDRLTALSCGGLLDPSSNPGQTKRDIAFDLRR